MDIKEQIATMLDCHYCPTCEKRGAECVECSGPAAEKVLKLSVNGLTLGQLVELAGKPATLSEQEILGYWRIWNKGRGKAPTTRPVEFVMAMTLQQFIRTAAEYEQKELLLQADRNKYKFLFMMVANMIIKQLPTHIFEPE